MSIESISPTGSGRRTKELVVVVEHEFYWNISSVCLCDGREQEGCPISEWDIRWTALGVLSIEVT